MIKIENLKKTLSSDFTLEIKSLHIEKGERVAIIGSNGSGKSTLLKLLAGIIKPDSGTILIHEKSVGYEPQNPYVFKGSVEKNVKIATSKDANIDKIINRCKLENFKKKNASLLSGGEKQRICFARMLAGKFSVLLLDEPLSAVDIETGEEMKKLFVSHCEENGTTLLFSTHLPSQAFDTATKILILNNGKVAEYSDKGKLENPESEFGKVFVSQWKI